MPITAQAPFDDTTASIVLRSSDGVDFYVYKEILKCASPFFRDMFSLPQSSHTEDEVSPEGLPIIPTPEDSESLDYILRLCYPLRAPAQLTSLSLAEKVMASALKYEIDKVVDLMKEELVGLGRSSPARLYMFSCRFGLETEAQTAADILREHYREASSRTEKDFVRIATEVYSDEYGQLPAIFFYRLLRHVQSSGEELARQSFCSRSLSHSENPNGQHSYTESSIETERSLGLSSDLDNLLSAHPADIVLQSSDGFTVPTHRVVLRISSGDTILSQSEMDDCPQKDGLPLVSVSLTGEALIQLIRACYFPPACHENGHKPEDDLRLFYSAQTCNMHKIATGAKERWSSHIEREPLHSYFIACSNGWMDEACNALRHMAIEGLPASTTCVPSMCTPGTAKYYYSLLQYYNVLHQVQESTLQPIRFVHQGGETWHNPSYALSMSITPVVAYRAIKAALATYNHSSNNLVDPPRPDLEDIANPNGRGFRREPARYIRAMVHDSRVLDEGRRNAIEAVDMTTIINGAGTT
ncbi:hypothetical protein QCA50_012387 [Cerrena zonata]|uniref:BTB domain-containing protein n=1 Tax=Cerrena zonata TaxID=2478898 RepID=A0AAW0FZZ9_9APHY